MKHGDIRQFTCTKCGGSTKVIDTRAIGHECSALRRTRVCLECGHRMYTHEKIVREAIT